MKAVFDHIQRIQGKPHHIRRRFAFGAAGVGTGLIAIVWFGASLSGNAFALKDTSFADAAGGSSLSASTPEQDASSASLAGAAAAPAAEAAQDSAHIEIVDTHTASTSAAKQERTIIPF